MIARVTYESLMEKFNRSEHDMAREINLRLYRSISWLRLASGEDVDPDVRFLALWIAFNSAYAKEFDIKAGKTRKSRSLIDDFFCRIARLDETGRIYNAIWDQFPGSIRLLTSNKYIHMYFWKYQRGEIDKSEWENTFRKDRRNFNYAFRNGRTDRILNLLFDRIYVLRNQMIHGSATHGSSMNRPQVSQCTDVMSVLVPIFIDIMVDNHHEDWGMQDFPVIDY